jgi:hypothetical protein
VWIAVLFMADSDRQRHASFRSRHRQRDPPDAVRP